MVQTTRPQFQLLAANFQVQPSLRYLRAAIKPSVEFVRAGIRISVVGATTDEMIYRWRAGKDAISDPLRAVGLEIDKVRAKSDLVIALTHIGLDKDRKIAQGTRGVDIVVGGHSHDALYAPAFEWNADRKWVPIVQAGKHGQSVGQLMVDVQPGRPVRVVSYTLVPVYTNAAREPNMQSFVTYARRRLEHAFGVTWLYEVLGRSSVAMKAPVNGETEWGTFFGEAVLAQTGADLSIDAGPLFGDDQDAGPVTREKLLNFFPRTFDFQHTGGWSIWLAECDGWIINLLVDQFRKSGLYASITGSQGRALSPFRRYTVAVPESIGRAITEMMPGLEILFRNPRDTGISVWSAVELELLRRGAP